MDSQINRIRKAEESSREFLDYAAKARHELENTKDPDLRKELIVAIESLEREAQNLKDALPKWREDIH